MSRWLIAMIAGAALVPVVLLLSLTSSDSLQLLASTLWLVFVVTEITSVIGLTVTALRRSRS